jgi:hypothetical protein
VARRDLEALTPMQLTLSSAAAPDAPLDELAEVAHRRGFAGVELAWSDAHGIGATAQAQPAAASDADAVPAALRVAALRVNDANAARDPELLRRAASLNAPVVVPGIAAGPELDALAELYAAAGARLLVCHATDAEEVARLAAGMRHHPPQTLGLAWEVRPAQEDLAAAAAVLAATGERLGLVRLYGGGPEALEQTGQGVGTLMARLTLAGYAGPLVVTPSTPRYAYAWRTWLARKRGGSGCGSKASGAIPLPLAN